MGSGVDKLFLAVAGRPVVAHTWGRFDACPDIDEVVLVVREGTTETFHALARASHWTKPYRVVAGGRERQDSVWAGLSALSSSTELVAIQDGARPCVTSDLIRACLAAARQTGAAVAAQRVTDTIKASDDGRVIARHLNRARLWAVQTPQTFRVEVIRAALAAVRTQGLVITDDTAACELIGQEVQLVESASPNPKLTTPADVAVIELLLQPRDAAAGSSSGNG